MSMGDPCICGDTESWHPECYQKQAEEAAAAHDAQIRADGYREGVEWAMMETRGCAYSCRPHDTAREYLVFLAQEMERHIKSLAPTSTTPRMEAK